MIIWELRKNYDFADKYNVFRYKHERLSQDFLLKLPARLFSSCYNVFFLISDKIYGDFVMLNVGSEIARNSYGGHLKKRAIYI